MIAAKVLVVVCVTFGVVSGSCVEFVRPQKCSSSVVTTVPVTKTVYTNEPCYSSSSSEVVSNGPQYVSNNAVFSGSSSGENVYQHVVNAPPMPFPVPVSENFVNSPVISSQVFNEDVFSSGSTFTPVVSSNENSYPNVVMGSGSGRYFDPETEALPVVQAPPVTLPTVESPMVTVSAPSVPNPKVLSSRCVCTKTIIRPQVIQRVITIPRVQRYLKRTVTPVVENLVYKSRPVSPSSSGSNSYSSSLGSPVVFSRSSSSPVVVSETPISRTC